MAVIAAVARYGGNEAEKTYPELLSRCQGLKTIINTSILEDKCAGMHARAVAQREGKMQSLPS